MDSSTWITAIVGLLGVVIGAIASPLIPIYARRFQLNQKAREALTTELGILVAMETSRETFDSRGELAKLIEKRLAEYLRRKHTGVDVSA